MHIIIWKYQVKAESVAEFEKRYNPNGTWANLFKKNNGYLGTEFLHDEEKPDFYVTIDRWVSREAYEEFKRDWDMEYKTLDAECEGLTIAESLLGNYEVVANGMR